jgi:hypothetical protein
MFMQQMVKEHSAFPLTQLFAFLMLAKFSASSAIQQSLSQGIS